METRDIEAAMKSAAESLRKTPAVRRRKNVSYAIVVKVGYEDIQELRNDGYSFDVICKTLSEKGALCVGASPKYFRTAFLREKKRRLAQKHEHAQNRGTNILSVTSVFVAGAEIVYDSDSRGIGEGNKSPRDVAAESAAGVILDMGTKIMNKASDIQPTITVRPGKRMGDFRPEGRRVPVSVFLDRKIAGVKRGEIREKNN